MEPEDQIDDFPPQTVFVERRAALAGDKLARPSGKRRTRSARARARGAQERAWAAARLVVDDDDSLVRHEVCLLKGALTAKDEWRAKVFDDAIVAKWRAEAAAQGAVHFDRAVEELRADRYHNHHGLAYADGLADAARARRLEAALDGVAAAARDFQPETAGKVQNLIHPSLYALDTRCWTAFDAFLARVGQEHHAEALRAAGFDDLCKLAGLREEDGPRVPELAPPPMTPAPPADDAVGGGGGGAAAVDAAAAGGLEAGHALQAARRALEQVIAAASDDGMHTDVATALRSIDPVMSSSLLGPQPPAPEPPAEAVAAFEALGLTAAAARALVQGAQRTCLRAGHYPAPLVEPDRLGKMLNNAPVNSNDSDEDGERRWKPRVPLDPLWHCTTGAADASRYHWLPAEVHVDGRGRARFASYVNNLLPRDAPELTPLLEQLLETALPGFEGVLANPDGSAPPYRLRGRRLQVIVKAANYILKPGETHEGGWHVEGMPAERIVATAIYYYSTSEDMRGGNLQFRRMRNLNLHEGAGSQRIHDTNNEYGDDEPSTSYALDDESDHDVPTGHPTRRFRLEYGAGRDASPYLWKFHGVQWAGAQNHAPVDEVATVQGRWLFFKNSLQHRLTRLYNASVSDTATRKVLIFWLCHPDLPVTSTADVPPQQWQEVMRPAVLATLAAHGLRGALAERVADAARMGLSREEAEAQRVELMRERKFVKQKVAGGFERHIQREFDFCEH